MTIGRRPIVLAVCLVLALGALTLSYLLAFHLDSLQGLIREQFARAFGPSVQIGEVHASFFPPQLELVDVYLKEDGAADPFFHAARLQWDLTFFSFLQEHMESEGLVVEQPTLRLMREDPSSRIGEELGMSICRFAGVRALILPRILSAGEAYELQAILIDPVQMRHVDRIRVTALGQEEVLLHAIDDLAREVRSSLGESIGSIEEADMPVVKATTSSWEALQYVAMGQERRQAGRFKEAEGFYNLAIEKDPHCLATLKHYRSLMPLAQEARKPMFFLRPADGAIGGHMTAVQDCYRDFRGLARRIADRCGVAIP